MTLRIAIVGAVESTLVALEALDAAGHRPIAVVSLPREMQSRHSDFVDLEPFSQTIGVEIIRSDDVNSPDVVEALRALQLDVIFVVGWSRICGPEFRRLPRIGALGYHPTLLPKMRGRAALAWTLLLDLKETGGTLFWLDEGVDSGDIAAQRGFRIPPRANLNQLMKLQLAALRDMLPPLFNNLSTGNIPAIPQDHGKATYLAVRRPSHGEIDWCKPAEEIDRLIRAVSKPYPGAFTYYKGRKVRIWSSHIAHYPQWHAQVGQVFTHEGGIPIVRCGERTDIALDDFEIMPLNDEENPPPHIAGQPKLGRLG